MKKTEFDLNGPETMKLSWLLSNGQIALLTCCNKKKTINGIITVGWVTPISFEPFIIMASVGSGGKETGERAYRFCYSLINETKEFGLNLPTSDLTDALIKAGTTHSDEVDKFTETGLTQLESTIIGAPMVEECFMNIECKVTDQLLTGDHTIFIAEPKAAFMNEDVIVDGKFSEKYHDKKNQLHMSDFVTMWNMW